MLVDNTSKLKDILVFKPNTYYKFVVLLREKDGKTLLKSYNKKELIVRQWLVDSQEKLDEMLPDMITFAKLFGGRLYVTTDRKSVYKTLFYMQDMINAYIKQMFCGNRTEISVKQLNKLLASASSSSECTDGAKKWLYDVDNKSSETLKDALEHCKSNYVCFETKNGYHVIADRTYDAHKEPLPTDVEVKDNGLALVYYNDEYYNELAETVIEGYTNGIKNGLVKKKKEMEDFVSSIFLDCKDQVFNSTLDKAADEMLMELLGK